MKGRNLVGTVAVAVLIVTGGCADDGATPGAAGKSTTSDGARTSDSAAPGSTDAAGPEDAAGDVEPVDVAALEAKASAAAGQVVARSRAFEPANVVIKPGQQVAWRFEDGQVPHGVVGDGFESTARTQGVVVHDFAKAGSYAYHCPIHPEEMKGTIDVR